jgi:hypothetical protein
MHSVGEEPLDFNSFLDWFAATIGSKEVEPDCPIEILVNGDLIRWYELILCLDTIIGDQGSRDSCLTFAVTPRELYWQYAYVLSAPI